MLNRIITVSFSFLGAITGFTILRTIFIENNIALNTNVRNALYILCSIVFCAFFYFIASRIIDYVGTFIDDVEKRLASITLAELFMCALGLIIGLIVANLVSIPIIKIKIIGLPISVMLNILLGMLGVVLAMRKRNENIFDVIRDSKSGHTRSIQTSYKILDTSTIIDGRILDVSNTGFLDGEFIIPSFILEELRHISDSQDALRRARGRRGLDILNLLQKEGKVNVRIEEYDLPDNIEVDEKLMRAAQSLKGNLVTTDYNLSKVAKLKGISVLNINDLANAVKPIALPGEEMDVLIVKEGKENGQGVAFLDDGTMVVVESGRKYVGEQIAVQVTSVLQTSSGRLVFAKLIK